MDRIEEYPGLSSWQDFQSCPNTLLAKRSTNCPWLRLPAIGRLPSLSLSDYADRQFSEQLEAEAKESHPLTLHPNIWMKSFGISSDEEVAEVNKDIVIRLRDFEEQARNKRRQEAKGVMGAQRLCRQAISFRYEPKKESRKIFVYSLDKELRIAMIASYKAFCKRCAECYEQWKIGNYRVEWPPGAFLPAMPPRQNVFA